MIAINLGRQALALALILPLAACAATPKQVVTVEPLKEGLNIVCIRNKDVFSEETASEIEGNNIVIAEALKKKNDCKKRRKKDDGPAGVPMS